MYATHSSAMTYYSPISRLAIRSRRYPAGARPTHVSPLETMRVNDIRFAKCE
jgi:hypothetical protein